MNYCNVKVPSGWAFLRSGDDVMALVAKLCGSGCVRLDRGSYGYSSYGPYFEGDLMIRRANGLAFSLAYDFIEVGDGVCRVFRVTVDRQPDWDGVDEYLW